MLMNKEKLKQNESGIISIIVVLLIMLILSLIVLAMSQNARKEQRQTLDRQLSDQAFYNAESGVNETINWLYNNPCTVTPLPGGSSCLLDQLDKCDTGFLKTGTVLSPSSDPNYLDADGNDRFTCILFDRAPRKLEFENVPTNDSKVVYLEPIDADTGAPSSLQSITFTWDDSSGASDASGCNFEVSGADGAYQLPKSLTDAPNNGNCQIGGIRIDLVLPQANRQDINTQAYNATFLPHNNGAGVITHTAFPNNLGNMGQADCSNTDPTKRKCSMTLALPISPQVPKAVLHLRSVYKSTNVSICASAVGLDCSTPVRFNNSQVMVDSTGRSSDILRRIQVRVPARPQYRMAEFAIQSADTLCKLLKVTPTQGAIPESECPIIGGSPPPL
jgi:hypothetical protein